MRQLLFVLFFAGILVSALRAENAEIPAAEAAPPAPAKPETPAAPTMSIGDAVEGILDEDEPTRKAAFARLDAATEADLPGLEKYENAGDPEIKRQVNLILQRLRRGEIAFQLKFPDGTPAAGQKVQVKLTEIVPPKKAPEPVKQTGDAAANANGVDRVQQIQVNGGAAGGVQIVVQAGNMMAREQDPDSMPTYKEVLNEEFTADAAGKVAVGRFNDGKYRYQLTVNDGLPAQNTSGEVDLSAKTASGSWEVKRGINVTVTVVDENGKPVAGATVIDAGMNNMKQQITRYPLNTLKRLFGRLQQAETDENGVAKLEHVGLNGLCVGVFVDGYEIILQDDPEAKDGSSINLPLKLAKIKPLEVTLAFPSNPQTTLKDCRMLLVKQTELAKVMQVNGQADKNNRPSWSVDKIEEYIKAGAVDLGKVGEENTIKATLMPEPYMLIGFPTDGTAVWQGGIQAGSRVVSPVNVYLRDLNAKQVQFRGLPMPLIESR